MDFYTSKKNICVCLQNIINSIKKNLLPNDFLNTFHFSRGFLIPELNWTLKYLVIQRHVKNTLERNFGLHQGTVIT